MPLRSPTPKVEFPSELVSLYRDARPGANRAGIFYLRLFLLSRKASNATIRPPKVNNRVNIPKKIEMIS